MANEIRAGDRFEMIVDVCERSGGTDDMPQWRCRMGGRDIWLPKEYLAGGKRLPRQIKVGDRVKVRAWPHPETIIHIDGDLAWTRDPSGSNNIHRLSDLSPADDKD